MPLDATASVPGRTSCIPLLAVRSPLNDPVVAFTDPPLTFVAVAALFADVAVSAAPAVAAFPLMPIAYVPDSLAVGIVPALR